MVGVNATADASNRLSVSSAATLFNHAGAGHRHKINKNAAADTASVLFQTAFSGRAEMGTAGDDDFRFKVSADGTAWSEALHIARATGKVSFPSGLALPALTIQVFTASGTWTKPAGCRAIRIRAIGGGGGGGSAQGGSGTAGMSSGGAAGTYAEKLMDAALLTTEAVTVGAGGTGGGTSAAEAGESGETTSFGVHLVCPGGAGGGFTAAGTTLVTSPVTAVGGSATGAGLQVRGARGGEGPRFSGTSALGGTGGASPLSGGAGLQMNAPGRAAEGHGGGGGGTASTNTTIRAGGNGGAGVVVVEEYY